jgi:hypothetical protein
MVAALPIAVGTGLAGIGLAGSLSGSSGPKFDPTQLLNNIQASKDRQNQIAGGLPGQLAPLGANYQAGITGAENTATTAEQAAAKKFLSDTGQATDSQGNMLSDVLKQRVLGALPEEQAALRESEAATGGLERGGAAAAFQNLGATTAQSIGQGEQQIALQQNQLRQQNLNTVLNMDNSLITEKLGIDKDTLLQLYNSGRQDLIDEANSLLGIEQTSTASVNDVLAAQQNANLGQGAADAARQQQLYQSLIGLGGTVAGGAYGAAPRVGAPATA